MNGFRALTICFLFFASLIAQADYLEVRKSVALRTQASSDSAQLHKVEVGTKLRLKEDATQSGYYHVEDEKTGETGWIYRSFVRRFPGEIPPGEPTPGASASHGGISIGQCKAPYNESAQSGLEIDSSCGSTGDAKPASGEEVQNPVKNNLCSSGVAKSIRISDLEELQKEVDDSGLEYGSPFRGKPGPPLDRSKLHSLAALQNGTKLGEGDLVSFVGYLAEAHYMPKSESKGNKKGGETVNCHSTAHEMADIHLALNSSPGRISAKDPQRQKKFCQTISAEMIPHFRPAVWTTDYLDQVIDLERPIRITGQLFLDASHEACNDGTPLGSDPARATVWEIHPVYTFDICKFDDIHKCDVTKETAWQPLSKATGIDHTDEQEN